MLLQIVAVYEGLLQMHLNTKLPCDLSTPAQKLFTTGFARLLHLSLEYFHF